MLKLVEETQEDESILDALARQGAQEMLKTALEAEVVAYVERHRSERDEEGLALVVRNGRSKSRKVTVGSGTFSVRAPRVNDKRIDEEGNRERFTSAILPP